MTVTPESFPSPPLEIFSEAGIKEQLPMIKNARFIQQLLKELAVWTDLGIISAAQKIRIENLYDPAAAPRKRNKTLK